MSPRAERRVFERRRFDATVFTYENGARFAAHPIDLSLGGAFLATEAVERIGLGDLISVVFGPESGTDPAVYVFARVMRRERGRGKGIGVEWVKAVTTGQPDHLAAFLESTFGVRANAAETHMDPGEGRFRCVFSFAPILEAGRRHRETMEALLNPGDVPEQPVERVRPASAGPAPARLDIVPAEAATDSRGILTAEMTVGTERASVSLEATMVVERVAYDVRVVELGLSSLEVVTVDPVPPTPQTVQITFDIPGRDRTVTVTIQGPISMARRIAGHRGTSLDVAVRQLDEGGTPGVWARFVKWCYFQSLRESDRS